jgi:hypothetical protein
MIVILKEGQTVFDSNDREYITEGTEKLEEGIDSLTKLVREFKGNRASDILGSLWDSMFDEKNLSVDYKNEEKYKFYERIYDLYYDLQDYEASEIYKDD